MYNSTSEGGRQVNRVVVNTVDMVYLDMAKAFDTVPHRRLLVKLEGSGISDQ